MQDYFRKLTHPDGENYNPNDSKQEVKGAEGEWSTGEELSNE